MQQWLKNVGQEATHHATKFSVSLSVLLCSHEWILFSHTRTPTHTQFQPSSGKQIKSGLSLKGSSVCWESCLCSEWSSWCLLFCVRALNCSDPAVWSQRLSSTGEKREEKNMLLEAPQSQTSHYKCQQENACCRKRRVGEAVLCFLIWFSGKASLQL